MADKYQMTHIDHGHETDPVPARRVLGFAVLLIVFLAVALALLWGLYGMLYEPPRLVEAPPRPAWQERPGPRLQIAPVKDWQELRAAQEAWLNGYGWIDREAGVARIPILRAMELLAGQDRRLTPEPPP